MSHQDEIKRLRKNKQRRLQKLKEQQAQKGINTEPEILTEIEDLQSEIEKLEAKLRELNTAEQPEIPELPSIEGLLGRSVGTEKSTFRAKLQIVKGEAIFQAGIDYLKEKSRKEVLIYAPTGVWEWDDKKKEWFKTISGCLVKELGKRALKKLELEHIEEHIDMTVTTKLRCFRGIYGLPTEALEAGVDIGIPSLDTMQSLFLSFNELENAELFYMDVDTRTIPGTGVIVIDDTVFIGFAVSGGHKVNYGFVIYDQTEIAKAVHDWFEVLEKNMVNENVIQRKMAKMTVIQGMEKLRRDYLDKQNKK